MGVPVKLNFKIYQGSTFKEVLRWESSTKTYKAITAIGKSAPCVITSTAHGIPVGWRTKVTNVLGMKEINSQENYLTVTASTVNSITLNTVNSLGYTDYTSSGVLEFNTPRDLTSVTARMQIRETLASAIVIEELTTANGKILIDNTLKTITLLLDATTTAAYTFKTAVYSLELIEGTEIIPFINGNISLEKEITR